MQAWIRVWSLAGIGPVLLSACAMSEPEPAWWEQLEADGPCYRVDLTDGLDESSTTELEDLYACLDAHGHLEALDLTFAQSLAETSRIGEPTALDLARLFNALPRVDIDPIGLVTGAIDWLQHPDDPLGLVLDLTLELMSGERASTVRAGLVDLHDPTVLEGGLLVPLAPVLPAVATSLLDDGTTTDTLADALESDTVDTLLDWGIALAESEDAEVVALREALPGALGEAITDTRSPDNDHHPGTSGDSLRDAVEVLVLADDNAIDALAPELIAILEDEGARENLGDTLETLAADGVLAPVPAELRWMVTIDVQGGTLQSGEDSALFALLRLLDSGNTEMECSLDLWVTDLEVNLGNLSVALLEAFADQDPDTVTSGVDLLSTVLGWGLSESVLSSIADSGVCPALDQQMLDDLDSIERLQDPEAYDLLVATLSVLSALKNADQSRIPELVDAVSTLRDLDAVEPVEEVVRDLGAGRLLPLSVDLLPLLLEPEAHDLVLASGEVIDLDTAFDVVLALLEPDGAERAWHTYDAALVPVLEADGTWEVLGNAAPLLSDENAILGQPLELVPLLQEFDPDRESLALLANVLRDPQLVAPALRLVEAEDTVDALLSSEESAAGGDAPLAWAGTLILDGTLDDLLAIVDLVLQAAEGR